MLRGTVKQDPMETRGAATIGDTQNYRADIALIAPWCVDPVSGATNHFLHGAEIAAAMVRQAARVVIMADHSKIGISGRVRFCPLAQIDTLVVDAAARARPGFEALVQAIPQLLVAEG